MKYQKAIEQEMEKLAEDEKVIFLGYNLLYGPKGCGTFGNIPKEKCIETPLAENLMVGLAMGLALEGFKPVLFFERHDFMLIALDALVNHLDKIERLSKGQFKAKVIIKATVGATAPIYPGLQHMQDFTEIFKKLFNFPVFELNNVKDIKKYYEEARNNSNSVMLIERKNLYSKDFEE